MTIATGAPAASAASAATLLEAVAAQDGVDHLQVNGAQPLDEASGAAARGGGLRLRESRRLAARESISPPRSCAAAASGWAWRTSSPDSPVRTR